MAEMLSPMILIAIPQVPHGIGVACVLETPSYRCQLIGDISQIIDRITSPDVRFAYFHSHVHCRIVESQRRKSSTDSPTNVLIISFWNVPELDALQWWGGDGNYNRQQIEEPRQLHNTLLVRKLIIVD